MKKNLILRIPALTYDAFYGGVPAPLNYSDHKLTVPLSPNSDNCLMVRLTEVEARYLGLRLLGLKPCTRCHGMGLLRSYQHIGGNHQCGGCRGTGLDG